MKKIRQMIIDQLRQGVSPDGIALTLAFSVTFGTFPILGATTLLCLVMAFAFKLNQPLLQAFNYVLTPVHILLIPVYLRIGEWAIGAQPVTIIPTEFAAQFMADWRLFLHHYGWAAVHAILAWVFISPFSGGLVFFVSRRIFKRISIAKD